METLGEPEHAGTATRRISRVRADRRWLLTRGAGLGAALPFGLPILNAAAQDEHDDMDDMEGDEAAEEHNEAPVASQPVQPFALYDPYLPAVQAGTKEITVVARDVVKYIANGVAYAGWSYDAHPASR